MNEKLCNVALAVPLRTTFTYKVPERLAAEIQPGSRVVVPFRKKSLVGVVTEWAAQGPPDTKLREVQKCLDVIPALTKNLLDLGQWISSYYVAPIGEVYRAMLPPLMELRAQQIVRITELGRSASASLLGEIEAKPALLQKLESANDGVPLQTALRSGVALGDLLKLQRRGLVEILQQIQTRKRRAQRIIAWRGTGTDAPVSNEKEARLRDMLLLQRGALPLTQLLKLGSVSRAFVERLLREGKLEAWEETLDPAEDPFDVGYTPPAHTLNPEQEHAFSAIRARFELGEFGVQLLAWRHRQRENRNLHAGRTGYSRARQDCHRVGARNCAHIVDGASVPRVVRRTVRRCCGTAFRSKRHRACARMVARSKWRSARHRRNSFCDFCACRKTWPGHCG